VARGFSAVGDPGPLFLKRWLQPSGTYRGPYDGGAATPPGVTTPDDQTIVFTFPEPHPDFPLAAALPVTAPVPKAKDTRQAYDTTFVASGPYRLKPGSYHRDQSMVLVRNEHWDPATDPIRHQYPDEFRFAFDVTDTAQTLRLLADKGDDKAAVALDNIPIELTGQVRNDAGVQRRVVQGETPYTSYLFINTRRVSNIDVRRALNYAFDRDAYVRARGGSLTGSPATAIASPTLPGFRQYDAYPAPPSGDPVKASGLLTGKTVPALTYCFPGTPSNQRIAGGVKAGLERAGLRVGLQPIDGATYNATTGRPDTTCDLIDGGWGEDYPDPRTVFEPLFGEVRPSGNTNLSYLADPGVVADIAKLGREPNRAKAAKGYADLDRRLMTQFAPLIPGAYERYFALIGSKVGGAHLSPVYGQTSLVNLFVT
jgi:peptide/nickel transport system substrate-binding protein